MLRKTLLVMVPILALLSASVLMHMARYSRARVEITGTVRVLSRPVPPGAGKPGSVVTVLTRGERVRIVKAVFRKTYTALEIVTSEGQRGYIFKSDSIAID